MLISIVTPVYDEAKYISAAIESVLEYTGVHTIELIVVDDVSRDETFEIASTYASRFPTMVKVYQNPVKGKVNAFNFAFSKAGGDFIVPFAGDDLLRASNIDARVEPLISECGPSVSLAALQAFFYPSGKMGKRTPLRGGGNKSGGAVVMNRAFADFFFPIPECLPNEDTWFNAVLLGLECSAHKVDRTALYFRVHQGNSWNRNAPYHEYTRFLAIRNKAYSVAAEKFRYHGSFNTKHIELRCEAEQLRLKGDVLGILRLTGMPLGERRHFVFSARPMLYEIKRLISAIKLPCLFRRQFV